MLLNGYDHGLRLFDTADDYGSHPAVAMALKQVPREKVTVLTKTDHRDAKSVRADLDRYRRELGTDYIDVLLIHCVTESDWNTRYRGVMDVLSEAKEKGVIRTHGELPLDRGAAHGGGRALGGTGPGAHESAGCGRIHGCRSGDGGGRDQANARGGKSHCRNEDSGQGALSQRQDYALNYALGLGLLDAFTIGATNKNEQMNLIARIAAA